MVFSTMGMSLMAASRDPIMLYIAVETTSITLYLLAGFMRADKRSAEAGLKYFLFGAFTSTIMLYGLSLLYGFTRATGYDALAAELAKLAAEPSKWLVMAPLLLVLVGLGFKISAVPFHFWAPDVYGAPTPSRLYLVASKAAGLPCSCAFWWRFPMAAASGWRCFRRWRRDDDAGQCAGDTAAQHQTDAGVLVHRAGGLCAHRRLAVSNRTSPYGPLRCCFIWACMCCEYCRLPLSSR
jgi:hypothetical protein